MLSDMTASPITSTTVACPVPSTTTTTTARLAPITSAIKRVGKLLCVFAVASAWPLDAFVEAQALLGLPIRTAFDNQDFLWRRDEQGDLYEPDPFSAESPFQRDVWPF